MSEYAKLKELAKSVKGWLNFNKVWEEKEDDYITAVVGTYSEDGDKYPLITVDCHQYDQPDDSIKVANFIAAANPETITNLCDENTRLSRQLAEAVKALEDITKTSIIPPDPTAHGWESFGKSAMALATEKQFKAIKALQSIKDIGQGKYQCTRKGEAHIFQLCDLEPPKEVFINSRGEIIRGIDDRV